MRYIQIEPATYLRPYVRQFLVLQNDDVPVTPTAFKVLADGCPGLIFQQETVFTDYTNRPFPKLFLHGLTTRHSYKTSSGAYRNIAVCLQPHALKSIFGIDAHLLTNDYIDVNDCVKTSLPEELSETSSLIDKLTKLSDWLRIQLAKKGSGEHRKIAAVIEKIKTGNGTISLSNIQADLRLSERSLERIMQNHIGVSPKLFSRICRFQVTLDHLCEQPFGLLTDLAYEYAYADQSHYIRDFREFAGVTPRQFLNRGITSLRNFSEWP